MEIELLEPNLELEQNNLRTCSVLITNMGGSIYQNVAVHASITRLGWT